MPSYPDQAQTVTDPSGHKVFLTNNTPGGDEAQILPENLIQRRTLALGNVSIPSYNHTDNTTHIDVVYVESGWNGFKYWAAHTPMPADPLEYPSIVASNDMETWVIPQGCPSPITNIGTNSQSNTYQHFADTHIVLTPDNKMRVYWLAINDLAPRRHGLVAIESADGVNWELLGTGGFVLEVTGHNLTSPSVNVLDDDTFIMHYAKTTDGARDLAYRTSVDGVTWGIETLCTTPSNYRIWHPCIKLVEGVYHMLGVQNYSPVRKGSHLTYLTSADGVIWAGNPDINLDANDYTDVPKDFGGAGWYRSGFVLREDGTADVLAITLTADGCGSGDTSGDTGTPTYLERKCALLRGVTLGKSHRFNWQAASNSHLTREMWGEPLFHGNGRIVEQANTGTAQKGFWLKWTSEKANGLGTGVCEKITNGIKPWFKPASNKGIGSLSGKLDLYGVLNNAPVGAQIISGTTVTSALNEINAGQVSFSGALGWALVLNTANPPSPALDVVPVPGDTIVGATSGASATVHHVEQSGRVIYPINPTDRNVFQDGEQILLNGTAIAQGGTANTISSQQNKPTTNGIAILCHLFRTGNADAHAGGWIAAWNTSASTLHGNISWKSVRG